MNIKLRKAKQEDIKLLREFEQKLIEHERTVEKSLKQAGQMQYYDIDALINDKTSATVIIAEVDQNPVGCGFGKIKENHPCYKNQYYGYIGLIYVDKNYRGNKICSRILDKIVQWFKEQNITDIILRVYDNNKDTLEVYKKYGFNYYIHEMKL